MMRVLVADDTEDIRMLLRLTLQKDGRFEIVGEARNGEEAIALAETERPDAIVLDLAMPVMDGLQALPDLRRLLPRCRIVVLSGFNASQMADDALSLGADAYLEKGAAFARLVALLLENTTQQESVRVADDKPSERDSRELAREAIAAVTSATSLDDAFGAFCRIAAKGLTF